MKPHILIALGALCLTPIHPAAAQADEGVRQKIVSASIAAYPGSCPCPYSTDRAGRRCGGRSAYSRPGGAAPKCYPSDVTAADVEAHRGRGG